MLKERVQLSIREQLCNIYPCMSGRLLNEWVFGEFALVERRFRTYPHAVT